MGYACVDNARAPTLIAQQPLQPLLPKNELGFDEMQLNSSGVSVERRVVA